MPLKSLLNAKVLSAVCVLIALTSGYFGEKLHAQARSAAVQAKTARADAETARSSLEELQARLAPDTETLLLDKAVGKVLLDIYNQRIAHGVTVSQVAPGKQGAGAISDLATISDDVPGTTVGSVKVKLTGVYMTYEGLLGYVQALQTGPVAVTQLKVNDRSFELSLRIYGARS